jgi:pyridoxal phosphate enzyme (YggS family)
VIKEKSGFVEKPDFWNGMFTLADRYSTLCHRLTSAAQRAGRDPNDVTLIAVSKGRSLNDIIELRSLGHTDFGENRVEEAIEKIDAAASKITWHMIGHIQSRKAKDVAKNFAWVHSVESASLAEKLSRAVAASPLPILLECNISGEESKYGLQASRFDDADQWNQLCAIIESILAQPNLQVRGLMTMAPVVEAAESARPVFRKLRQLRDKLAKQFPGADWSHLSMGMTDDFEVAIEEGATMVRIGRAIFAPPQNL